MSTDTLYTRYLQIRDDDTNIQGASAISGSSLLPIIQHLATENDLSEQEVKAQIATGFAEKSGTDVDRVLRTIDELIALREEAHARAMDWKESNMAERAAIRRDREELPA
ncbi:hypothetical protein [Corynebacterium doosanense]|uniref:Uncharacterized protein n=1 Tax=Corynebacterium doosanense CAU 212 = DSM 45436 TaxID=558173 RepID=A0A097IJF1_9CORY|nr:hypothetical protein [Corynebacterium doosanense]AIT62233.1 hypothetical protein CDOO_03945 [Corynebacterium doosanense CAU 212 = DSM 45436]